MRQRKGKRRGWPKQQSYRTFAEKGDCASMYLKSCFWKPAGQSGCASPVECQWTDGREQSDCIGNHRVATKAPGCRRARCRVGRSLLQRGSRTLLPGRPDWLAHTQKQIRPIRNLNRRHHNIRFDTRNGFGVASFPSSHFGFQWFFFLHLSRVGARCTHAARGVVFRGVVLL
jgi:hypothetical protein